MLSKEFILAGNATFTVHNATGEHYTYRVVAAPPKEGYAPAWFFQVLTGPNNDTDFVYVGMLMPEKGFIRLTSKSPYESSNKLVEVAQWALKKIWNQGELPEGYGIYHDGKCSRCGAKLTVPESIKTGLGPECYKAVTGKSLPKEAVEIKLSDQPKIDVSALVPHRIDGEIVSWSGRINGRDVKVINE